MTWDLAVVFDLATGETTWHRVDCKQMRTLANEGAMVMTMWACAAPPPDDEQWHDCLKRDPATPQERRPGR